MFSANVKPKRTAAALRGFLATARLSCFYMRFTGTATKVTYERSCDVLRFGDWEEHGNDRCADPYYLTGPDGELFSVSVRCYCHSDKCNGIGGWTVKTRCDKSPKEEAAAVSGQSGSSADPVMTVVAVVLFVSVIVAQLLLL